MGIRLKAGRFLEESDNQKNAAPAIVVNETFEKTFWGEGANAVGRRIRYPGNGKNNPWMTIVGVTRDVKHYGLEVPMRPGIYEARGRNERSTMMVAIHTTVEPASVVPEVRSLLHELDPEVPLFRVRTMEQQIRQSMALRAAISWMLVVFSGLAFVLAVGGAYGVATYLVTQRTREIGIRVALGAGTADVFRSVVASGLAVVAAGVAVGLVAAVAAARLLGDALFGVSTHDAGVLTIVTAVLLGTAFVANGVPARRAARIDPMTALREE